MDYHYLAQFLCALPSDARVTVWWGGRSRPLEWMARDFPREGRRFTSLTNGTELFITPEGLENLGVTSVTVQEFTIDC